MTSTESVQHKVKLYGHTSDDSDRFARELAVLLAIDETAARELLANVPVTIARTPSRQQAEHFQERIALIRGLCLVETEGLDPTLTEPTENESASLTAESLERNLETLAKKDSFASYLWLSALVGVSGIAVVVGVTIFLIQWWRTSAAFRAPEAPAHIESPKPQQDAAEVSVAEQRKLIRRRIEQLRSDIQDLEFQSKWQTEQLKSLYKMRPPPYEDIRRMKVQIARTEKRIRQARQDIRQASHDLPKE